MSLRKFRSINFRAQARDKISAMVEIIEEYQRQDLRLTARQLYYQFVSRGLCQNTPAEYKRLTSLLTDARYAGLVDWDAIEDRGRVPEIPSEWADLRSLVDAALRWYRLPRWRGQPCHAELWVEKQALAGVLEPIAREFHVLLMVNKGYSSSSAMHEASCRLERYPGCKPIILYLGDLDPSGEDMVRDIFDRLTEFGVEDLEVRKIALTMEQVRQYDPPPNPAKVSDSRAAAYIRKHGNQSWEVDALPPDVLAALIRSSLRGVIDSGLMDKVKEAESRDKDRLRRALRSLKR